MDPLFWHVARWLLLGIFAAALWHKLVAGRAFIGVIGEYRLMPSAAAPFATVTVVVLEALVVIGLSFAATVPPAALLGMSLLALYGLAIGINLARGRRDIDCGCLGPAGGSRGRHRLTPWLLTRNAALIGLGGLLLVPVSDRPLLWTDGVGIVAGVMVALLVWFAAEQLVANRPLLEDLLQ